MDRTEVRRGQAMARLDPAQRARLGQFLTPAGAAALVADLPRLPVSGPLRILDPGAGTGSLVATLVQRLLREGPAVELEIVAVEVDPHLTTVLAATLGDCAETAARSGSTLTWQILSGDFITLANGSLTTDPVLSEPFDLVVMNPPYRKLAARSWQRAALVSLGIDCPNIYAAFLALAVVALKAGGQLVAITPRSFANGPYFAQFRKFLLQNIAIDRLHVFESRSTVFSDTDVLQENIVFSGTRDGLRDRVLLSVSHSYTDQVLSHAVEYDKLVLPGDPHQFIRFMSHDTDMVAADAMTALPATLADLGLQVSTGRVVDFRSRDNLRDTAGGNAVPLIYPGNLRAGKVDWPRTIRKPQGFAVITDSDRKMLVPSGWYVVVKRFSAKEERRRVSAAVWDPDTNGRTDVAFENHLNFFHAAGTGVEPDLAAGLCLWLNSTIVDQFFRTFSGHTQVNATDLRSLRYPSTDTLRLLARNRPSDLRQKDIDRVVDQFVRDTGTAA